MTNKINTFLIQQIVHIVEEHTTADINILCEDKGFRELMNESFLKANDDNYADLATELCRYADNNLI